MNLDTEPATAQEVLDVLMYAITETVAALSESSEAADQTLEYIASGILAMSQKLPTGRRQQMFAALADNFIRTEGGADG